MPKMRENVRLIDVAPSYMRTREGAARHRRNAAKRRRASAHRNILDGGQAALVLGVGPTGRGIRSVIREALEGRA